MRDAYIADIGFFVKSVENGTLKNCIKDILTSILQQFKEIKSYDSDIIKEEETSKLIGNIEFDFNDMVNIVLNYKQLDIDKISTNDIKKIKEFWENYLDNEKFLEQTKRFVFSFVDELVKNPKSDKLKIKGIGFYFENFHKLLTNLKLCYNYVINVNRKFVELKLTFEERIRVIELLNLEIPLNVKEDLRPKYFKNKLVEYNLDDVISDEEINRVIEKDAKEKENRDRIEQKREKISEKPKSNYPRPMYKYSIKKSKGIVKIINKLFSKPIGFIEIQGYLGTDFNETLTFDLNDNNKMKGYLIKPFLDISNDIGNIFNNTEKLLMHMNINSSVLKSNKMVQKNIFLNFYLLDKKLSDFFYKFFQDIKNSGIYYKKNKAVAFFKMCHKIVNVFKNNIFNALNNYYNNAKSIISHTGADIEKIVYFFDDISVELSSLFININRYKSALEKK